mgnify:CR=1 FL=1
MEDIRQIEAVAEQQIRPFLQSHGGDLQIKDYRAGVVYVALSGACSGCPSADLSTKGFIENVLRNALPGVQEVAVEHAVSRELLDLARQILVKP